MVLAEIILGIVLVISIVGGITINNYLRILRDRQNRLSDMDLEIGKRLQRLDRLEERIEVLEKIVTDRRSDLMREFGDLDKTG